MMTPRVKPAREAGIGALEQRILASEAFRRSPRLQALFRYLAENSVTGNRELLSEQQVGIAVFNRPPGYNATEDSVVRVQVHNLRERLADYFAEEGLSEPVVITIPKGRYRLAFTPRARAAPSDVLAPARADVQTVPARVSSSPLRSPLRAAALTFVLTVVAAGATYLLLGNWRLARAAAPAATTEPAHAILDSLFKPASDTVVVMEDMMLVAASVLRGRPFSLKEYLASGAHGPNLSGAIGSAARQRRMEALMRSARFVNLANATFATQLNRQYPDLSPRAAFRHPRDVQMRDIRSSNCILFGAQLSNPWVDLYESSLNFQMGSYTGSPRFGGSTFHNRHPRPGEKDVYGDGRAGDRLTYARIALLPNVQADTRVLIVTGMGGAETEAAAQFLLARNFLEQLPAELQVQVRNVPRKLEILLATTRVDGTVGHTEVVTWRADAR